MATGTAGAVPVEGRVRLSLEMGLLDVRTLTASRPNSSTELSLTQTTVGLVTSSFGPGVDFGATDNVTVGARLAVVSQETTWDNDSVPAGSTRGVAIYGNVSFLPGGGALRPFVGPLIGFENNLLKSGSDEASTRFLVLGAQGGFHGFATDSFSIDPGVVVAYLNGVAIDDRVEVDERGFFVGLRLALSGWLGSTGEVPSAPPMSPEPAPALQQPAPPPGAPPPGAPPAPAAPPPAPETPPADALPEEPQPASPQPPSQTFPEVDQGL